MNERSSGVLLHITSLPGPYGSGTFGREARKFVDFLAQSGFSRWQVLPFSPPDLGNSPYTAYSAFAGNPLMIDPGELHREGLITGEELAQAAGNPYTVEFDRVLPVRRRLLRAAFARCPQQMRLAYRDFAACHGWVNTYGLFRALCDDFGGKPWTQWDDEGLRLYDEAAVARAGERLAGKVEYYAFEQFLFYRQWAALRDYAQGKAVGIMGDMPFYVSLNSADVWSGQRLFALKEGHPLAVAGAPPDGYSADGQLWGNPLYDFDAMAREGYGWWLERVGWALEQFDSLRIDHFRGFSAFWAVPSEAKTARDGCWKPGPAMDFFSRVMERFPGAPIIAEDLGVIDQAVEKLRERTGYPGMRVMQFAFAPGNSPHLPHNYPVNTVAYTGTHDNNTTLGWLWESPPPVREYACRYVGLTGPWQQGGPDSPACRAMMRSLWASAAATVMVPFQDIMGWGEDTRMNRPGVAQGCWAVRIGPDALEQADRPWLLQLNRDFERMPAQVIDI